jgi:hypothetical protein
MRLPGMLAAVESLDYETMPSEKLKIVVLDQSGHSCDSDVFINLKDVNDNSPSFDQELHMATVRENTSQSVVVTQVRIVLDFSYDIKFL